MDPNPPPPLIHDSSLISNNLCVRLSVFLEKARRKRKGPPPSHLEAFYLGTRKSPNGVLGYSVLECQGYRSYMEDRYIATQICNRKFDFFAVLDGHGSQGEGHLVSDYASKLLAQLCEENLERELTTEENLKLTSDTTHKDESNPIGLRFDSAFVAMDDRLRRHLPAISEKNGTTTTAVLIDLDAITFVNVGDSRGILINDDYSLDFVTLDHKPNVQREEARIYNAGGFVDDIRVNGDLAVSRTLGDICYKGKDLQVSRTRWLVSNQPDVTRLPRRSKHRAILLATDGLWDALGSQEVANILKKHAVFEEGKPFIDGNGNGKKRGESSTSNRLNAALDELLKESICTRFSGDNITILFTVLYSNDKTMTTVAEKVVKGDNKSNKPALEKQ